MIVRTFDSIGRRLREQCLGPVCLFLLLGLTHSVWAAPLTAWDFALNNGDESSVNATFVAPGFQSTQITRGGFHDVGNPQSGTFWNGSWPTTFEDGLYFQFSINPSAGTTYSISDIVFSFYTDPDGPQTWRLKSDVGGNNFTTTFAEWQTMPDPVTNPNSTQTTNLPPAFQNLTTETTFRLYGYNATGGGGAGLTSLSINGSTSVPEALPFGAFGLTIGLLFFVRSRFKA